MINSPSSVICTADDQTRIHYSTDRICALGIQPSWDSSAHQMSGVSVACALTQEDAACLWPNSPKGSKKKSDPKQLRVSHKTFLCSMTRRDPESGCLWYPLCLAAALRNICTLEYKAKNGRAHVQQRKLPEPKQRVNFIDFRICRDLSLWCSHCGGGLVAKLCPTLTTPWSPPGSSVHGILQARILEWVAISFSRGSSQHRVENWVLLHCGQIL